VTSSPFSSADNRGAGSEQVAARLDRQSARHDWDWLSQSLRVSISIGVVEAQPGEAKKELVKRSDAVMYARKQERHLARGCEHSAQGGGSRVTGWLRRAHASFSSRRGTADGAVGSHQCKSRGLSPEARTDSGTSRACRQNPDLFEVSARMEKSQPRAPADPDRCQRRGPVSPLAAGDQSLTGASPMACLTKAGAVDVVEL